MTTNTASRDISPFTSTHQHDSSDEDDLPYPLPLPRDPFHSPTFKPAIYLSTLRNRHQTLSDLRSELQSRLSSLQSELLDLVNDEYASFLHLGKNLQGGEERVEGVRVGVLGVVKGVEVAKGRVRERREEVGRLIERRRGVVREREVGVGLVEVYDEVGELERRLNITGSSDTIDRQRKGSNDQVGNKPKETDELDSDLEDLEEDEDDSEVDSGDDDDESSNPIPGTLTLTKLTRLTREYTALRRRITHIGPDHPFLQTLRPRIDQIRDTLLLDLSAALKAVVASNEEGTTSGSSQDRILKLLKIYADMGESKAGIEVLREIKGKRKS